MHSGPRNNVVNINKAKEKKNQKMKRMIIFERFLNSTVPLDSYRNIRDRQCRSICIAYPQISIWDFRERDDFVGRYQKG